MLAYVTLGSNDIPRAERFYCALLEPLGYGLSYYEGDLSYELADPSAPAIYIKRPFNGETATAGNGTMVALEAPSQERVRALHAAALKAGGTDEGAPGVRDAYSDDFYVAYLRDPDGNKIAVFSTGEG